ncbi:MAG: beta-hydroxyacyl-ACP dehydratase [Bacteroidales bacterium]|jgi:3-hydroxyacyl-[acyl-carrier-protein] dehydratase|nr:beta-hydroxyacyl-ACP dehydratase [Bacteroidaceae bacterium]NLA93659.1 beta-hydroxyacyl-ACP dehydratase [Bacteroidales bacterium]
MKLNGDFYDLVASLPASAGVVYGFDVKLNSEHMIYKAHFPGYPVTPGVCLLQMAAELASIAENRRLEAHIVKNMKFTDVVSPDRDTRLTFIFTSRVPVEGTGVKVQGEIIETGCPERVFSKFSLTLTDRNF